MNALYGINHPTGYPSVPYTRSSNESKSGAMSMTGPSVPMPSSRPEASPLRGRSPFVQSSIHVDYDDASMMSSSSVPLLRKRLSERRRRRRRVCGILLLLIIALIAYSLYAALELKKLIDTKVPYPSIPAHLLQVFSALPAFV